MQAAEWTMINRVKEEDFLHDSLERDQSNEEPTNYILKREAEHFWGSQGIVTEVIYLS